ncbi:MAG: hypothetical protein IJY90_03690 [Clostridia bacterium]|nr:hypothetical protein [Clostridia bacterium]
MEKVAIIELNENALRLTIYRVSGAKHTVALCQTQPFALGKEIELNELLSPQTKNDILNILKVYRKMIEGYGVSKIIALASNVLVRARNYRGFIDEIYNNTALNLMIMNDEEQIKYLFNSVVNTIDSPKGMFVYVGNYNSYIVKYNRRAILGSVVLPFGSYNAIQDGEDYDDAIKSLKKKINVKELTGDSEEEVSYVGLGNAFLALGKLNKKIARYALDIDNNYNVTREGLDGTYNFIKGLELDKIRKIKGISYDDADKIAGGLVVIKAIYEALNISDVCISTANIRDGAFIQNVVLNCQERFSDLLTNSLENYYEFNKNEFSVNDLVYNMSIILFKQLKVMHKLPRYYVKPLRIAAFMYDSGKSINPEQYIKYGFNKIVYSGINGVSHRELLLAGFICTCQDLDEFSLNEWIKYKDILTDEDLDAVRKLGVIVKLAVALNASHKPIVQDIVCDILGESIIMKTVVEGDASYEILEGMKVAQDYKKVYKKSLQII